MTATFGSRSALDQFGSAVLQVFGGTGKRHVLLLCPLEQGQAALEMVQALPPFKGRISLAVLPELHSTPVLALLADLEPSLVLALDATQPTSSGAELSLELQISTASTGLEYQHGGTFPAWRSSLLEAAHGSSLLACVAASRHRAVLACAVADVPNLLERL
jgi:hypothetical protein